MKSRLFPVIILLLASLTLFGQQTKDISVRQSSSQTVQTATNSQQSATLQLQADNQAIELKPDLKIAYRNRALCYRRLAEAEQDEAKKVELIAKAKADEEKGKE